ncbi:MAG TPA: hypothetical protein ENK26_09045 [Gammaproteobacteria bacterium]|nr:hypothetical protein [Gammaproteobacteria bacterium]
MAEAPDSSPVLNAAAGVTENAGGVVDSIDSGQALQQGQLVEVVASNAIHSSVTGNQVTVGVPDSGARAGNMLDGAFANYQGVLNVVQSTGVANSITQAVSLQSGLDIRTAPAQ